MHSSALCYPQSSGSTGCYILEKYCRCLIITLCTNTSSLPLISNYPYCSVPDLQRIRSMKNKLKQIALKYLNKIIYKKKIHKTIKILHVNTSNVFLEILVVALFFTLSQMLYSPENPCVFLPDCIQGAVEPIVRFRLLHVNHCLLIGSENTTYTYYIMKWNKCQW